MCRRRGKGRRRYCWRRVGERDDGIARYGGLPRRGSSFLAESFPRSRRFSSLRDLPILYISPSCTLVRKRHGPPRRNSVSSLALGGVGISKNFQHRYTPIFRFSCYIYTLYISYIHYLSPLLRWWKLRLFISFYLPPLEIPLA